MPSSDDYRQTLVAGAKQLDVAISEFQLEQLLAYHELLVKWNRAYNLTAVRDPLQMISRHLLDSLSVVPFLDGQRFLDVGTGAGLPGIVLAIIFPQKHFDLLDSAGKKMRFLFQVKTALSLSNVGIHHTRVETFTPDVLFDGVISRAFASIADMVACSGHLLDKEGFFYCMKGKYPEDELEALKKLSEGQKSYKVEACHPLRIPGDAGERHLLLISQRC